MIQFKIIPLLVISILFIVYGYIFKENLSIQPFYSNTLLYGWFILSFYPNMRLCIDYALILYSFVNDFKARQLIFKISKGRVEIERSWKDRSKGIYKWILISLCILTIRIIYEFI